MRILTWNINSVRLRTPLIEQFTRALGGIDPAKVEQVRTIAESGVPCSLRKSDSSSR